MAHNVNLIGVDFSAMDLIAHLTGRIRRNSGRGLRVFGAATIAQNSAAMVWVL